MKITGYRFTIQREPLSRPFGFKGGAFTEKWIIVTSLTTDAGWTETGIGGLAVLWSDPGVFFSRSEIGGNLAMALIADEAARSLVGKDITSPFAAVSFLADTIAPFARKVTGRKELRKTFILNCLVSLDLTLWKLFAREQGTEDLWDLLPPEYRVALPERHLRLGRVPLVDYNMPVRQATALADEGCPLLKIKLGSPGNQEEMCSKDKDRITVLHKALKDRGVLYYLDANGRYEREDTLLDLLAHAERIGMLRRILLLEEPYPEDRDFHVSTLPVRVAADESVHGPEDVAVKAALGYGAFTLKPAGKTLSLSLEILREAARLGLPCFVADSAAVPLLVEWNKCVAARLSALPGLADGVLESNGKEYCAAWDRLVREHPVPEAPWILPNKGYYETGESFFRISGGVFRPYKGYERLLPAQLWQPDKTFGF